MQTESFLAGKTAALIQTERYTCRASFQSNDAQELGWFSAVVRRTQYHVCDSCRDPSLCRALYPELVPDQQWRVLTVLAV